MVTLPTLRLYRQGWFQSLSCQVIGDEERLEFYKTRKYLPKTEDKVKTFSGDQFKIDFSDRDYSRIRKSIAPKKVGKRRNE